MVGEVTTTEWGIKGCLEVCFICILYYYILLCPPGNWGLHGNWCLTYSYHHIISFHFTLTYYIISYHNILKRHITSVYICLYIIHFVLYTDSYRYQQRLIFLGISSAYHMYYIILMYRVRYVYQNLTITQRTLDCSTHPKHSCI